MDSETRNYNENPPQAGGGGNSRAEEISAFLFVAVFLAPGLSVALVGSYGLLVWILE